MRVSCEGRRSCTCVGALHKHTLFRRRMAGPLWPGRPASSPAILGALSLTLVLAWLCRPLPGVGRAASLAVLPASAVAEWPVMEGQKAAPHALIGPRFSAVTGAERGALPSSLPSLAVLGCVVWVGLVGVCNMLTREDAFFLPKRPRSGWLRLCCTNIQTFSYRQSYHYFIMLSRRGFIPPFHRRDQSHLSVCNVVMYFWNSGAISMEILPGPAPDCRSGCCPEPNCSIHQTGAHQPR